MIVDYVWGVDVSTQRVAIAFNGPILDVRTVEFDSNIITGRRLHEVYFQVLISAKAWAAEFPPYFCWVEQPAAYGRPVEPQLMYAVGVTQAALYRALCDRFQFPVEVRTLPVGQWKKGAIGHGNADKAQVFTWAREQGYAGDSQDEADAWGVAWAGARLLGRKPVGQPAREAA